MKKACNSKYKFFEKIFLIIVLFPFIFSFSHIFYLLFKLLSSFFSEEFQTVITNSLMLLYILILFGESYKYLFTDDCKNQCNCDESNDFKFEKEDLNCDDPLIEYFKVFGIKPGEKISKYELKKRYHALMKKYHPDLKNSTCEKSIKTLEEHSKLVNRAFEYLSPLSF